MPPHKTRSCGEEMCWLLMRMVLLGMSWLLLLLKHVAAFSVLFLLSLHCTDGCGGGYEVVAIGGEENMVWG